MINDDDDDMITDDNQFDDDEILNDEDDEILDDEDDEDQDPDPDIDDDTSNIDDEDADDDDPPWVNKRVQKMAERHKAAKAKIKALESEVSRLTAITGNEDPKLYARVAEKIGILPRFISADDAKRINEADKMAERLETVTELIEELEDKGQTEFEDDSGKTWSRAELLKQKRAMERDLPALAKAATKVRRSARKQMVAVLNAGLKALRSNKQQDPKAKQKQHRQDDTPSRVRSREEDGNRRTRSHSAARRDYSPSNMSSRERAQARLRKMILAEYND